MTTVTFHDLSNIDENLLKYAVIVSRYNEQWIFCRHKERETWEIPGGHREPREDIIETAKRELREETGATDFNVNPVYIYKVEKSNKTTFGMLFFAEVNKLGALSRESEIIEIMLYSTLPKKQMLTYPDIQPHLFYNIQNWLPHGFTLK